MGDAVARIEGFPAPGGPLDVVLRRGTVVRISGRNGSGKTSLLRSLAGLDAPLRPRRVELMGDDPRSLPARLVAQRVGVVHQEARDGLVGLTVRGEYSFRGRPAPPHAGRQDVATLSSGEARRLAIDLAHGDLLLLDEPTEGLDNDGLARLRQCIVGAAGCVVVVDHEGALADLADVHIALGEGVEDPVWSLPRSHGDCVLEAEARDVHVAHRTLHLPALQLSPGFHAVAGPNGSGKSTLLRTLAGLGEGVAMVHGRAARPGHDVRWLSARAADHLSRATVAAELAGTAPNLVSPAEIANTVPDMVPAALLQRHPLRLSGGQMKRVALAKVLGQAAPVYLLDEPEAHLDGAGRAALRDMIATRIQQGSVVLAATHDPQLLAAAHSTIRMEAP